MTLHQETARIDIALKEIELIFSQGHVRMTLISNLTNMSVAFGGAIVAGLATLASTLESAISVEWFLVLPIPFFMFAFLILREDILMAYGDRYFYQLRERLLKKLGLPGADLALRFLPEIKSAKIGRWFTLLSGLRYGPPVIVVLPSLWWFAKDATLSCTSRGFINAALIGLSVILLLLLIAGIYRLGKIHAVNEKLIRNVLHDDG